MSWTLLVGIVLGLGFALAMTLARRLELRRMRRVLRERERAVESGAGEAQLQHPIIDLSRCMGCATCVAVCPEEGVLEVVHGQALVVNGARCVGVSACERECPVGAVTVTLSNLSERRDVPVLSEELESQETPGLFLAGEVTAHALIKTAIEHGTRVADVVAQRKTENPPAALPSVHSSGPQHALLDLLVVGAGPAGLACSLEAKQQGLSCLTIDQEETIGGTVAKYPRRKLVLTQPVELPRHGRLGKASYSKEDLMELWTEVVQREDLAVRGGVSFVGLERDADGVFRVETSEGAYRAHNVCMAIGRRGSPRKLGVPGEDLPHVAYSLIDAASYQGRRALVVGGGDSAVETALALAEQPGNQVTLSYRRDSFFRIKARNEQRLGEAVEAGRVQLLLNSNVLGIQPGSVEVMVAQDMGGPVAERRLQLAFDEVFVLAGGIAPFGLLEQNGVSFDPAHRPEADPVGEEGTGLLEALAAGFLLSAVALIWALAHRDYYNLPSFERAAHLKHDMLRPAESVGLWLGIASVVLIVVNLAYLLRRSPGVGLRWGSLQVWMTSHVATGILALLCAMLHGAMDPGDTVGGHAFWALTALFVTGAIGRYFYAWVPRAANGRELALAEVKARLRAEEDDRAEAAQSPVRRFRESARRQVLHLVESRQWQRSFFQRVGGILRGQRELRRVVTGLILTGRREGVPEKDLSATLELAREAHRSAVMAARYEDLRAVLATWRYLHRWMAAFMVILVVVHIVNALVYGQGGLGDVR